MSEKEVRPPIFLLMIPNEKPNMNQKIVNNKQKLSGGM